MPTASPETTPFDAASPPCRELLERVINSRELKRALRLRELLEYIGKRAHISPAHAIREQEIGVAVFGRPEDYDTSHDNIVRVSVSELRKRLTHYFQEEGLHEPIVMEIPRGGYLPLFLHRTTQVDEHLQQPDPPALLPAPALPQPAKEPIIPSIQLPNTPAQAYLRLLTAALLIAIAACGTLLWQNHQLAQRLEPWKAESLRGSFWADFFSSSEEVDIVTADTSFALAEDLLGQTISLDDYIDYKYKDLSQYRVLSADKRSALEIILDRNNGSIGDFQAAKSFMALDPHSSTVKLASARSYTSESIKSNNVILIGGRESNPWVELYRDRLNFFMEYQPGIQRTYIVNRAPLPGEQPIYETLQDRNRSYSVVAFIPNVSDHNYALIVSGADSQATRAAADFITSPSGLAQVRSGLPTGRFPYFELLLSSTRRGGTTLHTDIIASRLHAR